MSQKAELEMRPMVSVVVCVFNGAKSVRRCLDSLFSLNYENYEVILINDGSSDETDRVLQGYRDRVTYVKNEVNLGLAASRNKGVKLSRGEYVAFTDADCVVDRLWLTELVKCLTENNVQGAGGAIKTPGDMGYFARSVGTLHKPSPKLISGNEAEVPGGNCIFKKSLLQQMGGFDETFKESNADTDFNIRVWSDGTRILYQPSAVVYHYHRGTFSSFIRWRFINGIGLYRLAQKHRFKAKRLYHMFNLGLPPLLFIVGGFTLWIEPVVLPLLVIILYLAQLTKLYIKERSEFRPGEIYLGVLLGWLLRLSGSAGFWYAMITLPRNHRETLMRQDAPADSSADQPGIALK